MIILVSVNFYETIFQNVVEISQTQAYEKTIDLVKLQVVVLQVV